MENNSSSFLSKFSISQDGRDPITAWLPHWPRMTRGFQSPPGQGHSLSFNLPRTTDIIRARFNTFAYSLLQVNPWTIGVTVMEEEVGWTASLMLKREPARAERAGRPPRTSHHGQKGSLIPSTLYGVASRKGWATSLRSRTILESHIKAQPCNGSCS